jgi:DNA replication ATP-dependent helicase Dna2
MPVLSKQVISNYLRSDCQRRLRLDLFPDTHYVLPDGRTAQQERQQAGMPTRNVGRAGLQALAAAGEEWEEAKISDLVQTLGLPALIGKSQQTLAGTYTFSPLPLGSGIAYAAPNRFFVQPQFEVGPTFHQALGIGHLQSAYNLGYRDLRPDLIEVIAPALPEQRRAVAPDGQVSELPVDDPRLALRIIDIKLTAEPSVPYFIEVSYYAMALAAWLEDQRLDSRFYVLPMPTVWPGSHDTSAILQLRNDLRAQGITPTQDQFLAALNEDLEVGDFGVFAPRLRRFFQEELAAVLSVPWQQLPWHVDNRCTGCDYLGYPWSGTVQDPNHCWPLALEQDHLSRVAFISRGARGALEENRITDVATLAETNPESLAYDTHHLLRATRTVIAGRAQSLTSGQAMVPPQAGTSAIMPAWADLRMYLTADFDLGSGITTAFGFQAVWAVSRQQVAPGAHYRRFPAQAFPVDQRALHVEERELSNLLAAIDAAMRWAVETLHGATVQVYVWDTVTYDHLVRVIGRHLATFIRNKNVRRLAWLFPPDTVIANPDLSDSMSPVTVVRDVVRAVIAAPVPHYYSLLNVAREYHAARTEAPHNEFKVSVLFEDPLSDQIPSERAHEIWSRAGGSRSWNQQLRLLEQTVRVRLSALENIVERLGSDLQGHLSRTAPRITDLTPPTSPRSMAEDARLWFIFARLNVALTKLEIQKIHAMPPHEREARFKSAWLVRRLPPAHAQAMLDRLGLPAEPYRHAYELSPQSLEVRAREGDFTFAIVPKDRSGFLSEKLRRIAGSLQLPLQPSQNEWTVMEYVTQVTIKAIDREQGLILLDFDPRWWPILHALESAGAIDLSRDVMLDPVHRDYLVKRLETTLNAIGNPPAATAAANSTVLQATGSTRRPTAGSASPVGDVFWQAGRLYQEAVPRRLASVQRLLELNGYDLNPSQWNAWEAALTHRLRLIWGPPGTGKSRTLRTIVLGALHEAWQQSRTLRVLVTGPTYESIDNVLLEVHKALTGASPLALPAVQVARLRSRSQIPGAHIPPGIDAEADGRLFQQIQAALVQNTGLIIVGGPPQQVHKLINSGPAAPGLFDLILMDEASQVDVATSTLSLSGLAPDGSLVVAGDPKQLPPIHQAEAPLDLEYMVGPVFSYFERRFNLQPSVLEVNYRSCQAIVDLGYVAGYPRTLHAHSPGLHLDLLAPAPAGITPPPGWPANLVWTPEWAAFLDAHEPVSCFVYKEGRSSQWNQFEADAISALVWLLHSRTGNQLRHERDRTGALIPASGQAYSVEQFWSKGIGIVTPHRAQQALIISQLQHIFPHDPTQAIRGAVDTVERFQGQQRDIILATFALGDRDAISDEDEFLLSLNRFNVMASRARAKLIVFVSQEVVDHLSSDMDVLRGSALLKTFAETFCSHSRPVQLGYFPNATPQQPRLVPGLFRWRP